MAGYIKLFDDDGTPSAHEKSYEQWQFRRSILFHQTLICLMLIMGVVAMLSEEDSYSWADQMASIGKGLILGAVVLTIRAAAHVCPSEFHERARLACTGFLMLVMFGGCIADASTILWNDHTISRPSTWLKWLCIYTMYNMLAPILAITFALNRWTILAVVCAPATLPGIAIVTSTPTRFMEQDDMAAAHNLAAVYLLNSWLVGIIVSFLLDGMLRGQFEISRRDRDLADARGRYTAAVSHDFGTPIALLQMLLENVCQHAERTRHTPTRIAGTHACVRHSLASPLLS